MTSRAIHTTETRPMTRPDPGWAPHPLDEPSLDLGPVVELEEEPDETLEQVLLVGASTLAVVTLISLFAGVLGFLLGVLVAS